MTILLLVPFLLNQHFDLVFSNYVFHWFEHKEEGVKLTSDCLKPGGRFAIQYYLWSS